MSLRRIGPIDVFHGDPQFAWTSSQANQSGFRGASISGECEWWQAHQLSELVANPERRITLAGQSGVLEYIETTDDLLRRWRGWYLLQDCEIASDVEWSLNGLEEPVPFTLTALYFGDLSHLHTVLARSDRQKINALGIVGQAIVVDPFEQPVPFVVNPGGARFSREYDPTSLHATAALSPAEPGDMTLYAGLPGSMSKLAVPDIAELSWLGARGSDVRAFDRRTGRQIYGPRHVFEESTDILVTNGLFRFWVGNRLIPGFLNVGAFTGGSWRNAGHLHLSQTAPMLSARLVRLSPEAATVAVVIRDQGEALVTLRRGERGLRIQHGSTRVPQTETLRSFFWMGIPAFTRAENGHNGAGRFGKGLAVGDFAEAGEAFTWDDPVATWDDPDAAWDDDPALTLAHRPADLRLYWPTEKTEWTQVFRYRAAHPVDNGDTRGFQTIYSADGPRAVVLTLDGTDLRFKFAMGSTILSSGVQDFDVDEFVFVALRFSTTHGMAISTADDPGAVIHAYAPAGTDPGTTGRYLDFGYYTNATNWGDGDWGDEDFWGGDMRLPDGLIDNHMIFADWLSDAEVEALAAATTPVAGLPSPEARLIWHAAYDVTPIPFRSAVSSGRIYETDSGGDRAPDDWGMTKGVGVLTSVLQSSKGVGVKATTSRLEGMAYLATTNSHDDLADHQAQFAAESDQEIRVR